MWTRIDWTQNLPQYGCLLAAVTTANPPPFVSHPPSTQCTLCKHCNPPSSFSFPLSSLFKYSQTPSANLNSRSLSYTTFSYQSKSITTMYPPPNSLFPLRLKSHELLHVLLSPSLTILHYPKHPIFYPPPSFLSRHYSPFSGTKSCDLPTSHSSPFKAESWRHRPTLVYLCGQWMELCRGRLLKLTRSPSPHPSLLSPSVCHGGHLQGISTNFTALSLNVVFTERNNQKKMVFVFCSSVLILWSLLWYWALKGEKTKRITDTTKPKGE